MDKAKWQISLQQALEANFHKVVVKIKLGSVFVILYTLIIFLGGFLVGQRGALKQALMAQEWTKLHEACIQVEKMGHPYCMDNGNYYQVKKEGNTIYRINRKQNVDRGVE